MLRLMRRLILVRELSPNVVWYRTADSTDHAGQENMDIPSLYAHIFPQLSNMWQKTWRIIC